MTYRFEARESVGYRTTLQITDAAGNVVDISGWVFKASFERQRGSTEFTLNMAADATAASQGFWIINGPSGLLQITILPATLAGIVDTTGKFDLRADLLGTPSGGTRQWMQDIVATIIQGPTA